MAGLRQQILDDANQTRTVPSKWGDITIGIIGGPDRDTIDFLGAEWRKHRRSGGKRPPASLRATVVVAACRDENGQPLFKKEDMAALDKSWPEELDEVYAAAVEFNGLSAKSVRETEKNSSSGQSASTG